MTALPRSRRRALPLAAGALLALAALAGCHHENPRTPKPPPREGVDVSAASLATAEAGAPATFEVVLRSPPSAPVEVEIRSGDPGEGLLLAPGYAAPAPVVAVTFTPEDWDVARQVAVDPIDDHVVDGDVRYDVTLRVAYSDDAAYAAVAPVAVRVTNDDDDVVAIALSVSELSTQEGGSPARFKVRLTSAPPWGVYLRVLSGNSAEGLVHPGAPGACGGATHSTWLYFDAATWNVPLEVEVCPANDPYADGEQVYPITVSPDGSSEWEQLLAPATLTVTNADDDVAAVVVSAAEPLVTAENGATATFDVWLGTPPLADVTIPVTSGDPSRGLVSAGGSTPAASVSLAFTGGSWWIPQRVTVVGQEDVVVGQDLPYTVTVGPPTGLDPAYPSVAARVLPALNLDDDVARVAIDPAGPFTTSERGFGTSFVLSVNPPPGPVVVRVTSGDPTEGLLALAGSGIWQEALEVTFSPSDWSPREIVIVPQQDEVLDGDVSYLVTVAVASGDAGYLALPPQGLWVTNTDDLGMSVVHAAWDPTLRVPACPSVGYGCGSASLLEGRDNLVYYGTSRVEAHSPNTLSTAPSCPDGTYQYMDRSLDELKVYTLDGSPLGKGKEVRVEAHVRVYSSYWDELDLFHAADADAPSWTFVATLHPTSWAGSLQTLATTFVLPASMSGLQAIRGNWRYSALGVVSPCSTQPYDESDDLVFAVTTTAP